MKYLIQALHEVSNALFELDCHAHTELDKDKERLALFKHKIIKAEGIIQSLHNTITPIIRSGSPSQWAMDEMEDEEWMNEK